MVQGASHSSRCAAVTQLMAWVAREFRDIQKEVSAILVDRVLVGHAVKNYLEALLLSYLKRDIRDSSRHPGFRKLSAGRTQTLNKLAHEVLRIEIQGGRILVFVYPSFSLDGGGV